MTAPDAPLCDVDAETAVLNELLLCPERMAELPELEPRHFYDTTRRRIFQAVQRLSWDNAAVDIISVRRLLDDTEVPALQEVYAAPGCAHGNLPVHAEAITTLWRKRQLRDLLTEASARAANGTDDLPALLASLALDTARIVDPPKKRPTLTPLSAISQGALDLASDRMRGVEKPIPLAHEERARCLGGGYWPGVHFEIAGTGAGKSQIAVEDTIAAARSGVPCLYIALELDRSQVALRFAGEQSGVAWSKLYLGRCSERQLELAQLAIESLEGLPLYFEFAGPSGWPMSRLRTVLENMRQVHPDGPLLVVLDYLQLVADEPGERRELRERIGVAAYLARSLAVEFNAAIRIISSTARANYGALAGDAVKAAGITMLPGREVGSREIKVVGNPDALIGLGKESGELEFAADSVTVLLKWPHLLDGARVVLSVTAKGRATGASWCALIFEQGSRFVPLQVDSMGDLPDSEAKPQGRPAMADDAYAALVAQARATDPSIVSAYQCMTVLRRLGLRFTKSRLLEAWRSRPVDVAQSSESVSEPEAVSNP